MNNKNENCEYIDYIDHDAVVVSVDTKQGKVVVKVGETDDCQACPAARLCGLADKTGARTRTFTVETPEAAEFRPGQKVTLRGTERMHRRAIMTATVIPCIILVAVMVGIYLLTANQLAAACGGLASMLFFFVLLYLLRNKIKHEFHFSILHTDS